MPVIVTDKIDKITLDAAKCKLTSCYSRAASKSARGRIYYFPCDFDCLLKELWLYEIAITSWEQNDNGTTNGYTNYITVQQLKSIIDRIYTICSC